MSVVRIEAIAAQHDHDHVAGILKAADRSADSASPVRAKQAYAAFLDSLSCDFRGISTVNG